MKEYLFKAKRVDNGEWIEGFIVPRTLIKDPDFLTKFWIATGLEDEVYPVSRKSIKRSTGLFDKNKIEIFQEAILEWRNIQGRKDGIGFVVWDNKKGAWYVKNYEADIYELLYRVSNCSVIIDNIYDNPELLEEVKNENKR